MLFWLYKLNIMKKLIKINLLITVIALVFAACSTPKNTQVKITPGTFAGNWIISDIKLDMPSDFKVNNVFDEAPYQDFMGSRWNLIRNGKGSFTLNNGTKQDIYWSIYNQDNEKIFQFKKLEDNDKAKNVKEGYRLQVQQIGDTNFVLRSPLKLSEGKTGYISYTFSGNK